MAVALTRCARPAIGGVSAYTVLGFAGYAAASALAAVLFVAWELPIADRLVTAFAPPLAFLAVVSAARRIVGAERIVFYQTAVAGLAAVVVTDALVGGHVVRTLDIATVGIGVFLVFGRLGCFSVACCHGRPARFGVVYGPAHVRAGLRARWSGRPLWPVQLVECGASLALVIAALVVGWDEPGVPTTVYMTGYAVVRFLLELRRGDAERPQRLGVSEAQWTAPLTMLVVALWRPSAPTVAVAVGLGLGLVALIVRRRQRELVLPPHLRDLECAGEQARIRGERCATALGVAVTYQSLPDGNVDWVLSARHPAWSVGCARQLADALWPGAEVVAGRTPGVVHVITRQPSRP